ncbi:MAPEG family protein [Kordiimonas pumila]|uniref:MAPEG family protein n=1 Tax=Kordiimonas pumila TaxID=2161677 RepID=A0ABV7D6F4_9PROT|nr:MAPEG family protein [Kordiimonas pumila]
MEQSILTPVLVLVCWTLVLWVWLYATRLPAMKAAGVDFTKPAEAKAKMETLPAKAVNVANNYNHLHEQPVIFYALIFYIHLSGAVTSLDIQLAWAYVGLRVLHSLIQCTNNMVIRRFMVFVLASICLFALAVRAVAAL